MTVPCLFGVLTIPPPQKCGMRSRGRREVMTVQPVRQQATVVVGLEPPHLPPHFSFFSSSHPIPTHHYYQP